MDYNINLNDIAEDLKDDDATLQSLSLALHVSCLLSKRQTDAHDIHVYANGRAPTAMLTQQAVGLTTYLNTGPVRSTPRRNGCSLCTIISYTVVL